jgi:hypothetical protein
VELRLGVTVNVDSLDDTVFTACHNATFGYETPIWHQSASVRASSPFPFPARHDCIEGWQPEGYLICEGCRRSGVRINVAGTAILPLSGGLRNIYFIYVLLISIFDYQYSFPAFHIRLALQQKTILLNTVQYVQR